MMDNNSKDCLAVSFTADFAPERNADAEETGADGSFITWTFKCPKSQAINAGIYRLLFVRTLAEEEALGNPVLKGRSA